MKRFVFFNLTLFLLASCSLSTDQEVAVELSIPAGDSGLQSTAGTVASFDCVFINIVGPGIITNAGQNYFGTSPPGCIFPGLISPVVKMDDSASSVAFRMQVLAGEGRKIQVLGFASNLSYSQQFLYGKCPWSNLSDYYPGSATYKGAPNVPQVYELGVATNVSTYQNTAITIEQNAANLYLSNACPTTSTSTTAISQIE